MNFSLLNSGRDVSACINLMPDPDGTDMLVPAAPAAREAMPEGWRPLHVMPDGRVLLTCGCSVGFATHGAVTHSLVLDSEPRCCVAAGDVLAVLTASRLYRIDSRPGILPDAASCMPALRAVSAGNIRLDTPAVRLGATYTAGDRFAAADNRAAIVAVVDTVRDIDTAARMAGQLWQPVICRLRALDARGDVLFVTEPVLLSHPDGADTDIAVQFTSADGHTLAPASIEVPVWQPQIVWPAGCDPSTAGVASVELQCTPVLYRRDLSRGRVEPRRRSDQQWICTVSFAALGAGSGSFGGDGLTRRMLDIIGRIDTLASTAWSGRVPAGESPAPLTVPLARHGSIDDDTAALRRALARPVSPVSYADALAASGAPFTAAAMAVAGDTVAYADPVVARAAPPAPEHFFAKTASGAWHAYAEVTYADGSTAVSQTLGLDNAPLTIGPLLSVPAPDAVSITIGVRTAGGLGSTGTFALVPDPSGQRSVYVAPGAKPFSLGNTSPQFAVPEAKPAQVSLAGYIALARTSMPQRLLCARHAGVGRILALHAALAAQSAWDYGRSRFHIFADTGLYSLKADTRRRSLSATPVDSRVLDSPHSLADTDDGLAASLSGDIVLLSGNTCRTLMHQPGVLGMAYAHSHHELWCITAATTEVLCAGCGYARYTMTLTLDPAATVNNPGGDALITDTGGNVRRAGHGEPVTAVDIEWSGGISLSRLARGIAAMRADITGTFSPLTIAVHRRTITRICPAPELQLTVDGPLRSPIGRRFMHIPMREVQIRITATASPDSSLRAIEITHQ